MSNMKVQLLAVTMLAALGASLCLPARAGSDSVVESTVSDNSPQVVDTSPAQITRSNKFQRLVYLGSAEDSIVYRHKIDLPAGALLVPGADEAEKRDLTSDIEVVDAQGRVLGTIDAAWAQDETGQSLPSLFRIEGETLVQVVDSKTAVGQVTALLQYTGAGETSGTDDGSTKAYVGIPSNYVYNLNHPRKTLHDYCTKSPDEFPNPIGANANFRGPCARHDMCFEQRQASKQTCNNRLWGNLKSNCEHTYAWYSPTRQACINTAYVYWGAVTANTLWPW
jgi:hypothetical protein